MGKTAEMFIDYIENLEFGVLDFEDLVCSEDFKYEMHRKLASNRADDLPLLKDFLFDVFPRAPRLKDKTQERFYIMPQIDEDNKTNIKYKTLDSLYEACCKLYKEQIHFYFVPCYFTGWRNDQGVSSTFAFCIDIDRVGDYDFLVMTESEIKDALISTYRLPMELLPNWAVSSGHGIHLYYLIEELDLTQKDLLMLRNKYVNSMTLYFKADYMCANPSHIFRVPYSHNIKNIDNIRQTKLYHLNSSSNRSLSRLDYFLCTDEEFATYREAQKNRSEEKRKATLKANNTTRGRKKTTKDPVNVEQTMSDRSEEKRKTTLKANNTSRGRKKETKEPVNVEQAMSDILCRIAPEWFTHTEIKYTIDDKTPRGNIKDLYCNYSKMPSNSRYTRVLRDLHNYAARRCGVPIGFRNKFAFIYATYSKLCHYSSDRCYSEIKQYVEPDFYKEALLVVQKVYSYEYTYSLTLYQLALLLEFTHHDINHSFCVYANEEDAKLEAYRKYNAKRYEKQRKERTDRLVKRKEDINSLYKTGCSVREISAQLGIAKSTVHDVIKQIKEEESTLKHLPSFIGNQWENEP